MIAELLAVVAKANEHLARAVGLLASLAGSGLVEREEGLPVDTLLACAAGMTGADRSMLQTAADTLASMPTTAAAFADGRISWGQVRQIVGATKRLSKADRAAIDERIRAWLDNPGASDDPDQLPWAVDAAVDQLRDQRKRERSSERRRETGFVSVQPGLDGRVRVYGELDPVQAAPFLAALDAAAGPPTGDAEDPAGEGADDVEAPDGGAADAAEGPGEAEAPDGRTADAAEAPEGDAARGAAGPEGDGPGATATAGTGADPGGPGSPDAEEGAWSPTSRSRSYADALAEIAGQWLAGGRERTPRAAITCHLDLNAATPQPDGTLALHLRGDLPRVTAAVLDNLAANPMTLRVVLADGARPLAMTTSTTKGIASATRHAVAARDRGCRMPGCSSPAAHSDLHHHRVPAYAGGGSDPDELAMLCRRHHRTVEGHGWQLVLHPESGRFTFERGDRRWKTVPNGTPLPLATAREHDAAEPGMPF